MGASLKRSLNSYGMRRIYPTWSFIFIIFINFLLSLKDLLLSLQFFQKMTLHKSISGM